MRASPMTQGPRLQPRPQLARLSHPPCSLKSSEAPMHLSPRQPGHSSFKPHARLINISSRTSWMMGASAPPRSMPLSEGPLGCHPTGAVAPARTHALARRSLANRQPPQRQTRPPRAGPPPATAVTASSCASCPARPHRARLWRHFLL